MNKHPHARCESCTLFQSSYVPSYLPDNPELLVVGEAPGANEVVERKPFVGQSGKLLDAAVIEAGRDTTRVAKTNIVACRPPDNREPTQNEIECCYGRLLYDMRASGCTTVLSLGKTANETLLQDFTPESRGMWHKWNGYDVMPTWHPAYVLRKTSEVTTFLRDVRKAYQGYSQHKLLKPPEVHTPQTLDALRAELAQCPEHEMVAFDIETDQTQWYDKPGKKADAILCLQLAWSDEYAVVLDDEMLYDVEGVREELQQFASRKDLEFIAHNGKFDVIFLIARLGVKFRVDFDTMLAHYVLDENSPHGLKILAKEELGIPDYEQELISKYLKTRNDSYSKVPFKQLALYGSWDVVITRELAFLYKQRLISEGMYEWPYLNVVMKQHEFYTQMELNGFKIDIPYLQDCGTKVAAEMARVQAKAGAMVNKPEINLNSPQQVAAVLWDELKLPQLNSRKIKPRSTAEGAVEHLRGKHPFVNELLYYRGLQKIKSSYIENMIGHADVNGVCHPNVKIHGTEIGRVSMVDPAAMTIPRPGDKKDPHYNVYTDGAMIRGAIIARPGNVLVVCDFSQAELRVAAVLAQEPFLLDVYANDRDLHSEVALAMFGPGFTKEQRVMCKMFNFSYLYGGSEYSFAEDAGLPLSQARQFVHDYNRVMPRLAEYRKEQFKLLLEQGYVESLFKRRRRFPLINNDNMDDARKAAVHAPVAGTASDLTLLAGYKVYQERPQYMVVLTVHDSIVAEVAEDRGQEAAEFISDAMVYTATKYMPEVKWKADAEIKYRWVEPPRL